MLRINFFLAMLLVSCLLSACGKPTHMYTDTKDVKVDSISHVADGDFLLVTAVLVNKDKDSVQHSVYRMQWFGKDDNLLEQSSWRPVRVKGGAPVYVRERSTVPGAKTYTLVISNDAR